eukprot:TRINITY_DN17178_c0_g1_i11.p1 TRINITY_DN17178_c0_g1~~TRINITY_DN17178_c0_g1_i11.p1  ORF type:complete len:424 (+),score=82.66 TRINITY_DN17178_c0_g1_i11:144-1415(+)
MLRSLVGSEMCIRDSAQPEPNAYSTYPNPLESTLDLRCVLYLDGGSQVLVGGISSANFTGLGYWDGSTWSSDYYGLQMSAGSNQVLSLLQHAGSLFIAGLFVGSSGFDTFSNFAMWSSGTGWSGLTGDAAPTTSQLPLRTLAAYSSTQVSIGGGSSNQPGQGFFRIYNFTEEETTNSMCMTDDFMVNTVSEPCGGKVYVGGEFGVRSFDPSGLTWLECGTLAQSNWEVVPSAEVGGLRCSIKGGAVNSLQCMGGRLFVGGAFTLPSYKLAVMDVSDGTESWSGIQCCSSASSTSCPTTCTYDPAVCGADPLPNVTTVSSSLDASTAWIGTLAQEWSNGARDSSIRRITLPAAGLPNMTNADWISATAFLGSGNSSNSQAWNMVGGGGNVYGLSRFYNSTSPSARAQLSGMAALSVTMVLLMRL